MEAADFSGWATRAGLECSDGRTILKDAFKHQDGKRVPLVWQHGHDDPENILGYAILEHRDEGVYAHAYFNNNPKAQVAREGVRHGDITQLSIYANKLLQRSKSVMHGMIREVSLVLAGANPGALIDPVSIRHADDSIEILEEDAVIYTGLTLEHSDKSEVKEAEKVTETDDQNEDETVEHAATADVTAQDVYDSMSDEQKELVDYMIGQALEAKTGASAQHSEDDASDETISHEDTESEGTVSDDNSEESLTHQEGTSDMTRNVFEGNGAADVDRSHALTHDALVGIVEKAKSGMGFKAALLAHADEYGITDINLLFPDAANLTQTPQFISRRMEWVAKVLDGTKHSPFAKVKTLLADITADEARAKGYIKGTRKVEEVFGLLRRTTGPTTIYKKQKLDRDDILDITDIDVVNWLKAEMRLMIEEELARCILVGDGRSNLSPDKVKDPAGAIDGTGIRSILHDDDLYSVKVSLAANVAPKDAVKGLVRAMTKYRGTGAPTMFISRNELTDIMLEEDKFGRTLYDSKQALADKIGVSEIVTVDLFDDTANLFAIIVNLQDYTIGSNRGGELNSFEQFDIDFNQEKYLQEARVSGGLTKPFSAIVVSREQGTLATATAPSFDGTTNTITVPNVTGVSYFNDVTDEELTGDVVITAATEVEARADAGYYLAPNSTRTWVYTP